MAKDYKINMLDGGIFGKMLLFSVPIMLSGMLQLLFNTADTIVVGKFAGEASLAAVGSNSALVNIFINLFVGLAVGTNVIVAQSIGSRNDKLAHDTVHTSVLFSLFAGVVLAIIGFFASKTALRLMSTPDDVIDKATLYLRIYFLGMPVTMLYNYSDAIMRAVGDTRRPMIYLIIAGVINVLLNLLFVIKFKMDVAGVAIATIISQIVSAVLIVRALMKIDGPCRLDLRKLKLNKKILLRMMKIGIPSGVGGMVVSFSNISIQSAVNSFGKIVMAGNAAAISIEGFLWIAVSAFGQGSLSFTGQNYAAGNMKRIKRIVLTTSAIAVSVVAGLSLISVAFSKNLLSLYSDSYEVVKNGMIRAVYNYPLYFILCFTEIFGGALRGMGRSVAPTMMMVLTTCLFRIVWVFLIFPLNPVLENLYISYPVSWILAATVHIIYFAIVFRKEKKTMVISRGI